MNVRSNNIINQLRAIMPGHPIGLGETIIHAEQQAKLLLKLLNIRHVPVDVFRIANIPGISVRVEPRHQMPSVGGYTRSRDDKHIITVNQNDPAGRRRFTLAHEFKHCIDDGLSGYVYINLGHGDDQIQHAQIEHICNHFAACFTMPTRVVKRAWFSGIQDPEALAELFRVSTSSMMLRLKYLGLTRDRPLPTRYYFNSPLRFPADAWMAARPPAKVCGLPRLAAAGRVA